MTDPVLRVRASMPVHPTGKPRPAGWWVVAGGIVLVMAFIAIQGLPAGRGASARQATAAACGTASPSTVAAAGFC